jgi:hypothetical protein
VSPGSRGASVADEGARYYGVYRAVVLDTRDPMQKGRVSVRVPAVTGDMTSEWALVAATAPREGNSVVVAFEEGRAQAPIVIGVLWGGGEAPSANEGEQDSRPADE